MRLIPLPWVDFHACFMSLSPPPTPRPSLSFHLDTGKLLVIVRIALVLNAKLLDELDALLPQLALVEVVQRDLVQPLFPGSLRFPDFYLLNVFNSFSFYRSF
jgi:hypothetical protein